MEQRLDFYKASPDAMKALIALEVALGKRGLETTLVNLVKLRASQINGCAYCVDSHSADARKAGETERRLYAVAAWRETPFFSERERSALAWTESLTRLSEGRLDSHCHSVLIRTVQAVSTRHVPEAKPHSAQEWRSLRRCFR